MITGKKYIRHSFLYQRLGGGGEALRYIIIPMETQTKMEKGIFFQARIHKAGFTFRGLEYHFQEKRMVSSRFTNIFQTQPI